ncbi:MAG: LacI family DNA-binding transcriptional regulator [Anaerolineae bacterium]|nr:LacI family DNA-binding transcriptional regulator [Anaerolineae bacterium]
MAITMEDVARRAGVAKSTVSLALNNRPGVSPELKEAILKASSELGYSLPRQRAAKSAEGCFVAILHHEDDVGRRRPTELYLNYLSGIKTCLQEKNVNFSLFADYRESQTNLGFYLLSTDGLAPDGLILMGTVARRNEPLVQRLLKEETPFVVLGRNWPDLPISTVSQDHHQQALLALTHLYQLGHRTIAFLAQNSDRKHDWFDWRLKCYKEFMQQHYGKVDETLITLGDNGEDAAKTLLAHRPDTTAIFAINDLRAVEAMPGVYEAGYKIPADISIIGLDNAVYPPTDYPSLTTVGFPHFEVGYQGAELLLKQIENNKLDYVNILVRSELIERDSCAKPHI